MADRIDRLFQEWYQLGGAVLLANKDGSELPRSPEEVIAESTAYCRESGRLTWVVVDWLIHHIDQIDEKKLLEETGKRGDMSVLGVLNDIAYLRTPHPKFKEMMTACVPHNKIEPFFYRVARSPLASRLAQENNLEVFRRWNYLCNELRYLK
jgi:hypothetical protein